jgi:hypothetical protein
MCEENLKSIGTALSPVTARPEAKKKRKNSLRWERRKLSEHHMFASW